MRVKRNVLPFADGMDLLKAIRPVTFEYNGVGGTADIGKVYVGVIAQELQQVAPYMVDASGEYLKVDPSAFTYLLVNAGKDQQAQIEAMKADQSASKAEIETLRAEIEAIKATFKSNLTVGQ